MIIHNNEKKNHRGIEFAIVDDLFYKPLGIDIPRIEIFAAADLDQQTNLIKIIGILIYQTASERKILYERHIVPTYIAQDPAPLIAKAMFMVMDKLKEYPYTSALPIYLFTNNPTMFTFCNNFLGIINKLKKESVLKAGKYATKVANVIISKTIGVDYARMLIGIVCLSVEIKGQITTLHMFDTPLKYPEAPLTPTKMNKYGEVTKLLS